MSETSTIIRFDDLAETIYDKLVKTYKPILEKPIAMFTMGIPASGKSSSVKYVLKDLKLPLNSVVNLDPDDIMDNIPGYTKRLRNNALKKFNKSAVIVAGKVYAKLVANNISFVYYGTGKSFPSYRGMLSKTNKAGYVNGLISVELGSDEAIIRNSVRERSVGPGVIKEISASLKSGLTSPRYARDKTPFKALRELDFMHFVYTVDTLKDPPTIELVKSTDTIELVKSTDTTTNVAVEGTNKRKKTKRAPGNLGKPGKLGNLGNLGKPRSKKRAN